MGNVVRCMLGIKITRKNLLKVIVLAQISVPALLWQILSGISLGLHRKKNYIHKQLHIFCQKQLHKFFTAFAQIIHTVEDFS